MSLKRNKIKIFLICSILLIALFIFVQTFALTSSYLVSNTNFFIHKLSVCRDNIETDDNNLTVESKNETNIMQLSQIYGTVFVSINDSQTRLSNSSSYLFTPLENATVAIMYIEDEKNIIDSIEDIKYNNTKTWRAMITKEDGNYKFDLLIPGLYEIRASKQGYLESKKKINLDSNQSVKLYFSLEKISTQNFMPSENMTKIIQATKTGDVGSEITVWQEENKTYDHEILIYDSVNITKLDVKKGILSFTINGSENSDGKTITLNVDSSIFNSEAVISVEYDDEPIKMAEDINDILDPNDDGANPEYLVTEGANGMQILISIPHFSEHKITIFGLVEEIVETLGGTTAVILYISICVVASVVFIGSIYVRRKI